MVMPAPICDRCIGGDGGIDTSGTTRTKTHPPGRKTDPKLIESCAGSSINREEYPVVHVPVLAFVLLGEVGNVPLVFVVLIAQTDTKIVSVVIHRAKCPCTTELDGTS
jgi:hypothetical protein